mgnify:CR=1 FL=1
MSTLPAVNYISDTLRTEGEMKAALEAWLSATKQIPGAGQAELAVTISGGAITPAGGGGVVVVDPEAAAATDDLTNIIQTNYPEGCCLLLRNANSARAVVVKNAATGSGQINLDRDADYVLDTTEKWLLLQRRSSEWYELMRGPDRLAMPTVTKTASFTVNRQDHGTVFVCSGSITVSFSAAAVLGNGFTCAIVNANTAANTITLDPNGSELINRMATVLLQAQQAALLVCTGSAFRLLGPDLYPSGIQVSFANTISVSTLDGNYFEVGALSGNVTSFIINDAGISGARLRFRFVQDATGGRTVTLPTGAKVTGSLASTANQASVLDLTYTARGSRWEGFWTQIPL